MTPAPTCDPPSYVRRVGATSFAIISEVGAAFLIDCGDSSVAATLRAWRHSGLISGLEGCWVTHYHDDHVDGLGELRRTFDCPIIADARQAEIIEHPLRFHLPCISPLASPVDRATADGESWRWREFRMTAFHFPGQTVYGGGLLVEGRGRRLFFGGDSGAPTGIDDHCPANRNFLGRDVGFRRCIALWRELRPDLIFNQHQDRAFVFSDAHLDHMDGALIERERLLSDLLPWPNPNFGTDENWVRCYPYEQEAAADVPFWVDVQCTNHGPEPATARVEPVLPDGWRYDAERSNLTVQIPPQTCGAVGPVCGNPDRAARVWIVPHNATQRRIAIPMRVTWGDRYLGQFRHATVVIP
jgi:phosphoribosyl 1,2-cyclic phosphodiesterase